MQLTFMPILPIEDRHTLTNNSNVSTCLIRSIALPFHTLIAAVLGQRENNLFDVGIAWRRRQKITSRMRTLFILSRAVGVGVLRSQGRYCKALVIRMDVNAFVFVENPRDRNDFG